MRTEDGDEIVEPGDYDMGDGQRLRVYLTEDDEGERAMWACTHCQEVDGVLNSILVGALDGLFGISQDESGEFQIRLTEAGLDSAKRLIKHLTEEPEGGEG